MVINADPGNLNTVVSSTRPLQLYLNNIEILFIRITTGILGFVGFLENLVIIFTTQTKGRTFLLVPSNIFLLSLAAAEILLCGVVFTWYIKNITYIL